MTMRRVMGITGIRSDYYFQRPILQSVMEHSGLELELVVAGAHLSPLHGHTEKEVEADGFPIVARIDNLLYSDRDSSRLKGAALQLQVLAHIVDDRRPDWLLAVGDREEALNMALCGAYMNVPVAHYGAGDRVVGNVDDTVRHAVSNLAHIMLTTHEEARQRLIRAGQQEWRVHNVGHAGVDRIRSTPGLDSRELASALGVPEIRPPYLIVIQHPISSEIDQAGFQMEETLAAVKELDLQTFVSYPNSDPGSQEIARRLESENGSSNMHVFRNIPDQGFVNLLRGAAALVGNSSLGILEAPFLRLPVVNVGQRQAERHHAGNVFFVPHDRRLIAKQIRLILNDKTVRQQVLDCSNPFGDGHAGEWLAEILAGIPQTAELLNKDLSF